MCPRPRQSPAAGAPRRRAPARVRAVEHEGFNLHTSVRIAAEDDRGVSGYPDMGPVHPSRSSDSGDSLAVAYRIKTLGARSMYLTAPRGRSPRSQARCGVLDAALTVQA